MFFILAGVGTYLLFFIFFPGGGVVITRRRWRNFRNLLYRYYQFPELTYKNLEEGKVFSFQGRLESFKNDDILWIKSETLSICVELAKVDIYSLYSRRGKLDKINWNQVSSMVEGTPFLIVGKLEYRNGIPYLVGSEEYPILVVIHDSSDKIFEYLIVKGREKSDMWNSYTPYSHITGVLILIILSYLAYRGYYNKTNSFYLMVIAGTPFYFILPPGLFFNLKFRRIWNYSIRFSVLRDLYKLHGNYLKANKYNRLAKSREKMSLLYYVCGYLLNITIAGIILFKMYQLLIYGAIA